MDLTLNIGDGIYNSRVSAMVYYKGRLLMDYDDRGLFPIGGRIKINETIEDALKREVMEELSVAIVEYEFLSIGQASYHSQVKEGYVFEHNFIFKVMIEDQPQGKFRYVDSLEQESYRPSYLLDLGKETVLNDFIDHDFGTHDICRMISDKDEFNVRISAIIRDGDKILFDCGAYDPMHKVVIGGRMQMGETLLESLKREVVEELSTPVVSSQFLGIGEDFFDLRLSESKTKRIHFISFIYEVEVDIDSIVYADGCQGEWIDRYSLPDLHMNSILKYI